MRNLAFAIGVAVAGILAAQSPPPAALPRQAPTVRLVYEVPPDPAADSATAPGIGSTVSRIQARLPEGAKATAAGAAGFTVDVVDPEPTRLSEVRQRVETLGILELRAVAGNAHRRNNDGFDFAVERRRLQAWLDSGGRERLQTDARALDAFHADPQRGPLAGPALRWHPHRIEMDPNEAGRWCARFAEQPGLQDVVLAGFASRDWNDGTIPGHIQALPADQRYLLEFVAVDMREPFFANRDLAATSLAETRADEPANVRMLHLHDPKDVATRAAAAEPGKQEVGTGLKFRIVGQRAADFADWSEVHRGEACVILWDGEVAALPRIECRVPGEGVIAGAFPPERVRVVHAVLQAAPLATRPRLLRREPPVK